MKYVSTRGQGSPQSFEQVLLTGLAPDGGLYVPETLPQLNWDQISAWKELSYPELALEIAQLFIGEEIPRDSLKQIIDDSYVGFDHSDVAPLVELGSGEYVLELFHGPTLAFKDASVGP